MGATFTNLSCEDLCELMCGKPEEDDEMGGRGGNGSRNVNNGIPAERPTKEQLIKDIKALKGKDLEAAIDRLDSF